MKKMIHQVEILVKEILINGFRSNHDRSLFKRLHHSETTKFSDRNSVGRHRFRSRRKSFQFKGNSLIYAIILLAVFGFAFASIMLRSSITSVFRQVGNGSAMATRAVKLGTRLRFVPSMRFRNEGGLDLVWQMPRIGVRPPRLALGPFLQFLLRAPKISKTALMTMSKKSEATWNEVHQATSNAHNSKVSQVTHTVDGCATFLRRDRFAHVKIYEVREVVKSVSTESNMLMVLLPLSKYRMRNVPVIEPGNAFMKNFITQSAVVRGLEGCRG